MFYVLAAVLFFFEGVGVKFIPNAMIWGLFCVAIGLATGGPAWMFWKKTA